MAMKIHTTTLNTYGEHIHPVATMLSQTWQTMGLVQSSGRSLADVIMVNGPGAPPYKFDQKSAEELSALKKPIIILVDHEGEGRIDGPDEGWSRFVHWCPFIRAALYREWKVSDDSKWPFALVPYDLVGYDPRHPKEFLADTVVSPEEFHRRDLHITSFTSIHPDCQSRVAMDKAIRDGGLFKGLNLIRHDRYTGGFITPGAIYQFARRSKLTFCLEGSGIKCNWHTELGSLAPMLMPHVEMHDLFPWVDMVNCVRAVGGPGGDHGRGIVDVEKTMEKVRSVIDDAPLHYSIYRQGAFNSQNYRIRTYYPALFKQVSQYV